MSPLQYKIYQFIKNFLAEHGHSPTLLEIAIGIGISPRSKGLVSRYVHDLVKSKKLVFERKGYRNINLPPSVNLQLPVEGRVAAGSPIELDKDLGVLDLTPILCEKDTYAIVVHGDFLAAQGILDGDKIIYKRQPTAKEGSLIIAKMNNRHAAINRIYYLKDGKVQLKALSSTSSPIVYPREQVNIQGVVVGILRLLHLS